MRFEWDEEKNRENQRKHGISFDLAVLMFADEHCLIRRDRVDDSGEQRWHAVGAIAIEAAIELIVVVVHVYRESIDGEEVIRIISARPAEKRDVRRYQEQEVD